ncbi:hypothetical protein Xbud_02760 [Xenorhabdus budapestensis]|nr:hypothetical protein Xbud_02760 [Xenorhabdus budapestensis]
MGTLFIVLPIIWLVAWAWAEKMHDKVTATFIERENYKLYLIYVSNYLIHDQLALDGLFQFNACIDLVPGFK